MVFLIGEFQVQQRAALRLLRLAYEVHVRLLRRAAALLDVASHAGTDDVFPGAGATLAARPDVKCGLLDFEPVNYVDVSAGDELLGLVKELESRGITVAFARVRDSVRDDMRRAGIEAIVGPSNFHERITEGVRAWQRQTGPSVA